MKPLAPVLGLLLFLAAGDRQPHLSDFLVTRQGNELLFSFQLEDAFGEPTFERIDSGLPTGFTYQLKLERTRKWWFNRTLSRSTLEVVAMYNAITREYLVNYKQDGRLIESRVVQDAHELERAMTTFHALPIFEVQDVPGRVVAMMRVELGSRTVLGFIPTKIHTDWVRSEAIRARGNATTTVSEEGITTP